jgi:hypothetical protein
MNGTSSSSSTLLVTANGSAPSRKRQRFSRLDDDINGGGAGGGAAEQKRSNEVPRVVFDYDMSNVSMADIEMPVESSFEAAAAAAVKSVSSEANSLDDDDDDDDAESADEEQPAPAAQREGLVAVPHIKEVRKRANNMEQDDGAVLCAKNNKFIVERTLANTFGAQGVDGVTEVSEWYGGHILAGMVRLTKKGTWSVKNWRGARVAFFEKAKEAKAHARKLLEADSEEPVNRRRRITMHGQHLIEVKVPVVPRGLVKLMLCNSALTEEVTTILINAKDEHLLNHYHFRLKVDPKGESPPLVMAKYSVEKAGVCLPVRKRATAIFHARNMTPNGPLDYRDLRSELDAKTLRKLQAEIAKQTKSPSSAAAAAAAAKSNGTKASASAPLTKGDLKKMLDEHFRRIEALFNNNNNNNNNK